VFAGREANNKHMDKKTLLQVLFTGISFGIGFLVVKLVMGQAFTAKLVISALVGGLAGGITTAFLLKKMEQRKNKNAS
jgi:hypothetical protein